MLSLCLRLRLRLRLHVYLACACLALWCVCVCAGVLVLLCACVSVLMQRRREGQRGAADGTRRGGDGRASERSDVFFLLRTSRRYVLRVRVLPCGVRACCCCV